MLGLLNRVWANKVTTFGKRLVVLVSHIETTLRVWLDCIFLYLIMRQPRLWLECWFLYRILRQPFVFGWTVSSCIAYWDNPSCLVGLLVLVSHIETTLRVWLYCIFLYLIFRQPRLWLECWFLYLILRQPFVSGWTVCSCISYWDNLFCLDGV